MAQKNSLNEAVAVSRVSTREPGDTSVDDSSDLAEVLSRIGVARAMRDTADDLSEFAYLSLYLEELYIEAAEVSLTRTKRRAETTTRKTDERNI